MTRAGTKELMRTVKMVLFGDRDYVDNPTMEKITNTMMTNCQLTSDLTKKTLIQLILYNIN